MPRRNSLARPETVRTHRATWWVWGWDLTTGERALDRNLSQGG